MSISEFYLILMESKVIEAQQPKYLVTFTLYGVIFSMPIFRPTHSTIMYTIFKISFA